MEEIIVGIVVGVISSLLASTIFLLALYRIKPNILISQKISKYIDDNGQTIYQIKIANFTSRRVVDIRFELYKVDPIPSPSLGSGKAGTTRWLTEMELKNNVKRMPELSAFNPCVSSNDATRTDYACRIEALDNIETVLREPGSYLRFVVYATDSLSGLHRVFTKDYVDGPSSFLKGQFYTGQLLRTWTRPNNTEEHFAGKTTPGLMLCLRHQLFCRSRGR